MAAKKKTAVPALLRLGSPGGLVGKATITALALSADNRFAVTGDLEGVVRVFDLGTDTEVGTARITRRVRKRDRQLTCVTVANDGRRITAVDRDGDLFCGKLGDDDLDFTLFHEVRGGQVLSCADGSRVALLQGGLQLYEDGKLVWKDDAKAARGGHDLAVAPDGRIAVVHYENEAGFIRLYDGKANCRLLASVEVPESCWYARIGFASNERVVVITQGGGLFSWNGKRGGRLERRQTRFDKTRQTPTLLAPLGFFVSGADLFTFDDAPPREVGARAWACALDGSVVLGENGARIERLGPDLLLPTSTAAFNGWVRAIAFEPDHRFVWTADDAVAHRWALPSGAIDRTVPLPKNHFAHGVSADARVLLLKTHDAAHHEQQQLFDLGSGKRLRARIGTHSRVSGLSADGRLFAYGVGKANAAEVLDVESGKVVRTLAASSPRTPYNAVPSADGRFVVTVNNRYEIVTFDGTKELASFVRPPGVVMSMKVSKTGKWFVFGRDNAHHLEVWTLGGRQLPSFTGLRRNDVDTLALSDDEQWVAASDGVAIGVWRFSDRKRVLSLQEGAGALAFSRDARQLAVGGNGSAFVLAGLGSKR